MGITLNTALRNQQVDAVGTDLNSGFIDIYTGSRPADPNTAPTGTLLVSLALNADAYAAASGGSASKNGTVSGTAVANGTAGYAQQRNAANTRWMYGTLTVSGGGGDVELDSTSISIGQVIALTSSTITQPAS